MSVLLLIVLLVLTLVVVGAFRPAYRVRRSSRPEVEEIVYEDEIVDRRPRVREEIGEEIVDDPPPTSRRFLP